MFSEEALSLSTKKAIIANLLRLRDADREASTSELGYILHVAIRLGLSEEDVHEIHDKKETFELQPPKEEKDRVLVLYYFLFFMNADGKIEQSEIELVKQFGFKLGMRPELVRDLIDILISYKEENVPPEALLDKIKAYLN